MNLSVNPRNGTVKAQEINDCPRWQTRALQNHGYDLLTVSTSLPPLARLVVISVHGNSVQSLQKGDQLSNCTYWWNWAFAFFWKGRKKRHILFLPSSIPSLHSFFLGGRDGGKYWFFFPHELKALHLLLKFTEDPGSRTEKWKVSLSKQGSEWLVYFFQFFI